MGWHDDTVVREEQPLRLQNQLLETRLDVVRALFRETPFLASVASFQTYPQLRGKVAGCFTVLMEVYQYFVVSYLKTLGSNVLENQFFSCAIST